MTIKPVVYIIESPSVENYEAEVCEGKALSASLDLMRIDNHYFPVYGKNGFARVLQAIKPLERIDNYLFMPVLHVSAHGNENEFALMNDERITWNELRDLLIPINTKCDNALVLSMSVCKGASACKSAMSLREELPYLFLIGPIEDIEWGCALLAFLTFYQNFSVLTNENDIFLGETLVNMINSAIGTENLFRIQTAQDIQEKYTRVMLPIVEKHFSTIKSK